MRRTFISFLLSIIAVLGANNLDCAASLPGVVSNEEMKNINEEKLHVWVKKCDSIKSIIVTKSSRLEIFDKIFENCYYIYDSKILNPSFTFKFFNIPNGAIIFAFPKKSSVIDVQGERDTEPSSKKPLGICEKFNNMLREDLRIRDLIIEKRCSAPTRSSRIIFNALLEGKAETYLIGTSQMNKPTIVPPSASDPSVLPLPEFWK